MTEPVFTAPTSGKHAKLALRIAILGLAFYLGSQTVDPRTSQRLIAAVVTVTGLVSGIMPLVAKQRPRVMHWLGLATLAIAGLIFGLLARMLIRAFHGA